MILALLVTASCATSYTRPPRLAPADPAAALANLRRHEARVRTMRARFQVRTMASGERRSAAGVLLVRKPGWFRMRLFLPLGLSILDYLYRDGRSWRSTPHQEAPAESASPAMPSFLWEDLSVAFLRGTRAFPGTCESTGLDSGNFEVLCEGGEGALRRWMEIDARDGTLIQEATYDAMGRRFVIGYRDYRRVDGQNLPFRITLDDRQRKLALDIEIDRYEINPELPDRLFQPLPNDP